MNQVLEFNRIKAQEPDFKVLDSFVSNCITLNIEAVSNAMSVLNEGQEYAIESFVYRLIAAILAEKDKEVIVREWINGGTIFLLKDRLVDGFKKSLKI